MLQQFLVDYMRERRVHNHAHTVSVSLAIECSVGDSPLWAVLLNHLYIGVNT